MGYFISVFTFSNWQNRYQSHSNFFGYEQESPFKEGSCFAQLDNRIDHYLLYSLLLKDNISGITEAMNAYDKCLRVILSSEFISTSPQSAAHEI